MINKIAKALKTVMISPMEDKDIVEVLENDDTNLIDAFGLDSLLRVQFIIEIEEIFDIDIDIEELDVLVFKNCGDFKKMILNYL